MTLSIIYHVTESLKCQNHIDHIIYYIKISDNSIIIISSVIKTLEDSFPIKIYKIKDQKYHKNVKYI